MRSTISLWIAAVAVAALGTWICYDAIPGINWMLWTSAAATGLIFATPASSADRRPATTMAIIAIVLAAGAAISADEVMNFLTVVSVVLFLALAMLLSVGGSWRRITAGFTVAAPIVAFGTAVVSGITRAAEATTHVRSARARAALRGFAITAPVLVAFALLLAVADPTFALWRNSIRDLVTDWEFLPRVFFFVALLGLVIGTYGYVALTAPASNDGKVASEPKQWLGSAERGILLAGVAGLLWLFMALQLSYLFGNLPRIAGSGMTFAEYARRGFGELTIVASLSALIIIGSERYGVRDSRDRLIRILTLLLIVAVLFLLGSAFHRVLLYERAYGFTTARLYAQIFMVLIAASLVALLFEVRARIETGRLFRRVGALATGALILLMFWNHQSWIAQKNIERFSTTGKLDVAYLTRELSLNAIPTIVESLDSMSEPMKSELHSAIDKRYRGRYQQFDLQWFEWNRGRARAQVALEKLGVDLRAPLTR